MSCYRLRWQNGQAGVTTCQWLQVKNDVQFKAPKSTELDGPVRSAPSGQLISRRHLMLQAAAVVPWIQRSTNQTSRRANLLLTVADDLGYGDLSSYGCPDIGTPRIDSIGETSVRFVRFYANAPQCTPTRAALLTGRYLNRFGGLECAIGVGNVGRYDEAIWLEKRHQLGVPPEETVPIQALKRAGYDTACIGKWHLGYEPHFLPPRHGFDHFFGILGGNADYFRHTEVDGRHVLYQNEHPVHRKGYLTDLFAEEALAWLKRRSDRPFFLYLAFNAPHTPGQGPNDAHKKLDASNWNQIDRKTYKAMVERMDWAVGQGWTSSTARVSPNGLS